MPQYNQFLPAKSPSNLPAPLLVDLQGSLLIADALSASYNITVATVIKATPGRVAKVIVQVAGSAAGTVNNCITTGAAAIANQIATIPAAVAVIPLSWPCSAGITVVPGTGQTLTVSFI